MNDDRLYNERLKLRQPSAQDILSQAVDECVRAATDFIEQTKVVGQTYSERVVWLGCAASAHTCAELIADMGRRNGMEISVIEYSELSKDAVLIDEDEE